jgi:hypothetical protein
LIAAGCSAALPLPGTVAECDAETAAVKSQIDGKKAEMTLADNLLKSLGEEKAKLEGQPESDARARREEEIARGLDEASAKKESLQEEIAVLEERLVELGDHRKSLAESEAEAKKTAEEEAKAKADAEADARKKADEEARMKSEAEARAAEEAKKKAEEEAKARAAAEADARRKADEEARMKSEAEARAAEEAKKKAEEEARVRAEAAAQKQLEDETRRRAEAKVKGDECVVQGTTLFREVADGAKNPPDDPAKVQALLKKDADAIAALEKAKEYYAQMPAGADPGLEARLKKIDQIIGLLRHYADQLKK